jgi:hypothetical protein
MEIVMAGLEHFRPRLTFAAGETWWRAHQTSGQCMMKIRVTLTRIVAAIKSLADTFLGACQASRLVVGNRKVDRKLEAALAWWCRRAERQGVIKILLV